MVWESNSMHKQDGSHMMVNEVGYDRSRKSFCALYKRLIGSIFQSELQDS